MSTEMYGYVRVSTKNQNEERQIIALRQFGVSRDHIIVEKQSGKNFNRPLYQELVEHLHAGDVLVLASLDRLGRNYEDMVSQWKYLTKEREIGVVVLDMPILDTRKSQDQKQNLVATLVTDLVIQLLSYFAQAERESILQRQAEGIAAAKQRGVQFGRRRMTMPEGFEELAEEWWDGYLSSRKAAEQLHVSPKTFIHRAMEWGKAQGRDTPTSVAP